MRSTHELHHSFLLPSCIVPLAALFESDTFATEDIESTADREINFAVAQPLHQLQVMDISSTTRISDRDCTDLGQMANEFLVNTCLQAFGVCCVDEEFAAVRFQ